MCRFPACLIQEVLRTSAGLCTLSKDTGDSNAHQNLTMIALEGWISNSAFANLPLGQENGYLFAKRIFPYWFLLIYRIWQLTGSWISSASLLLDIWTPAKVWLSLLIYFFFTLLNIEVFSFCIVVIFISTEDKKKGTAFWKTDPLYPLLLLSTWLFT